MIPICYCGEENTDYKFQVPCDSSLVGRFETIDSYEFMKDTLVNHISLVDSNMVLLCDYNLYCVPLSRTVYSGTQFPFS